MFTTKYRNLFLLIGLLLIANSHGAIRDKIIDAFNSLGMKAKFTDLGAYRTQSGGYYASSNFQMRTSDNIKLKHMQMPSSDLSNDSPSSAVLDSPGVIKAGEDSSQELESKETFSNIREQSPLEIALAKVRSLEYAKVQKFIKDHKIYFVYAGFCHNCHKFSPVVSNFTNRFKLDLQALSFDGGVLDEFPDYIKDDGKLKKFRVMQLPMLVVVDKETDSVTSKWVGARDESDLINWLTSMVEGELKSA